MEEMISCSQNIKATYGNKYGNDAMGNRCLHTDTCSHIWLQKEKRSITHVYSQLNKYLV